MANWLTTADPELILGRLFEPAVYDLVAARLPHRGVPRLGWAVAWTLMECVGVGAAELLLRGKRPTRLGWAVLGSAVFLLFLIVVRASYHAS